MIILGLSWLQPGCISAPSNLKYKIWAHRPSIEGTKSLIIIKKAILIIKRFRSLRSHILGSTAWSRRGLFVPSLSGRSWSCKLQIPFFSRVDSVPTPDEVHFDIQILNRNHPVISITFLVFNLFLLIGMCGILLHMCDMTHSNTHMPRENGENAVLWRVASIRQVRARPIDKLDETCTNTDDRMMLVQHRSGDCVMS